MRSRALSTLSLTLLAALALPTAALAGKATPRAQAAETSARDAAATRAITPGAKQPGKRKLTPKAELATDAGPLVPMLPDITVELVNPTGPHYPVLAKLYNDGPLPTGAFQLSVEITALCEAGKLQANLPVQNATPTVQPLASGEVDYVSIMPASQVWSDQCHMQVEVVADAFGAVNESDESNNKDTNTFCVPGGSCY